MARCRGRIKILLSKSQLKEREKFQFLFHGKEFRVVFSSAEWFGTEFREFKYYGSTEWNSELCLFRSRVRSEQNYGSLLLFLFHGTEFRVILSSAEGFATEFRDFLFRGTTGIPSEITICSVYSVFRGIIFLSEIPNPNPHQPPPPPPHHQPPFPLLPRYRRKIRLIESNAKCCYFEKMSCKVTLRQVFYLSEASSPALTPYSLPHTLYTCIQCTYSHREWGGGGQPERMLGGNSSQSR